MKTLSPKPGKGGKIHPSPPGTGVDPTTAALRLLPAAMLVLTAALCPEDQQVLAHLITRSLHGATVTQPVSQQVRGRRRGAHPPSIGSAHPPAIVGAHPPAIGCGCFECYTSFWSRWNSSPSRGLIDFVIDSFDKRLAAAESSSSSPSSSSKRREKGKRKPPPPPPPMSPESQAEKPQEPSPTPASPPPSPPTPAASTVESDEEKVPEVPLEAENAEAGEEERKRGWADVMGMLNLRLWGIWSPAVESAT